MPYLVRCSSPDNHQLSVSQLSPSPSRPEPSISLLQHLPSFTSKNHDATQDVRSLPYPSSQTADPNLEVVHHQHRSGQQHRLLLHWYITNCSVTRRSFNRKLMMRYFWDMCPSLHTCPLSRLTAFKVWKWFVDGRRVRMSGKDGMEEVAGKRVVLGCCWN